MTIINLICEDLRFTMELQCDFKDNPIPTLDYKLTLDQATEESPSCLSYTFFEKEVNSKYVIMERSSMSFDMKRNSLAQDVCRRLDNLDKTRDKSEGDHILDYFDDKLKHSGYSQNQRRTITISGIRNHLNKIKKAKDEGRRSVHRNQYARVAGLVFVDRTEGGELATLVKQKEAELRKICKTSSTLKSMLMTGDPWSDVLCQDNSCMPCMAEKKNKCIPLQKCL